MTPTDCKHTDLACLLRSAKDLLGQIAADGQCQTPGTFYRPGASSGFATNTAELFYMLAEPVPWVYYEATLQFGEYTEVPLITSTIHY